MNLYKKKLIFTGPSSAQFPYMSRKEQKVTLVLPIPITKAIFL